jgi:hypothetical protein
MGKPLDTQSKVYGLLKVTEFYVFIIALIFCVFTAPTVLRAVGAIPGLVLLGGGLLSLLVFLVVSNQFPNHFFFHYLLFKFTPQVFKGGRAKDAGVHK